MTSFAMLAILATTPAAPPQGSWSFVDEATHHGRPVITFRSVELSSKPARPLHKDDVPPTGASFGVIPIGPDGKQRLGLVWHAESGTLWLDADVDGRYGSAERHTLGDKAIEIRISIALGGSRPASRTLLIRRRGEGLAYAIRGYCVGQVTLAGTSMAAMLTDGDGDGCFDHSGHDRVWLDLDGDGKFDPLTEQFPLGTIINHAGSSFLAQPRADGLGLVMRERPSETGTLVVKIDRLPGAEIVEFAVQYVSEFGELVTARAVDKDIPIPAGKYRVELVRLRLSDAEGKAWSYGFSSGDRAGFDLEIEKGRATVHRLLDGLKASATLDVEAVKPGDAILVQPDVTAGRLVLTRCEVGSIQSELGRVVPLELRLNEPGSITIDQASSGFV
jgi:hypothetical protein